MKKFILVIGILICQSSCSQAESPNLLYEEAYKSITNGNYENSIKLLEKAIKIDNTGNCGTGINGKAHNELGFAYMRTQNYEMSRKLFDSSIRLSPKNPDPRMNKVASYILEKDLENAKNELDTFIKELPGYPTAYWQKGNILENEGEIKEALFYYRKARDFNEKNSVLPKSLIEKINQKLNDN